jgi:hypothetical protein
MDNQDPRCIPTNVQAAFIFSFILMYPQKVQYWASDIFYYKLFLHSDVHVTMYGALFSLS